MARATDKIATSIERYLLDHASSDNITWDASIALTPQGPMILVVLMAPGAVLGSTVHSWAFFQTAATEGEGFEAGIRQVIEKLHEERSKQLAMDDGQAPQPSPLQPPLPFPPPQPPRG